MPLQTDRAGAAHRHPPLGAVEVIMAVIEDCSTAHTSHIHAGFWISCPQRAKSPVQRSLEILFLNAFVGGPVLKNMHPGLAVGEAVIHSRGESYLCDLSREEPAIIHIPGRASILLGDGTSVKSGFDYCLIHAVIDVGHLRHCENAPEAV